MHQILEFSNINKIHNLQNQRANPNIVMELIGHQNQTR